MKAPEKLYLEDDDKLFDLFPVLCLASTEKHGNEIEYIRKDVFIEKACDAYCRLCDTKECGDTGECEWVKKFRKRLMR